MPRVLSSTYCAKTLHAQLPDIPLRSDTQALRLIANIPLIQRRKSIVLVKKKRLRVVVFRIYARSLKDQARKSKYPRT